MEAWGNDKTNGGKRGRRTEPRKTQSQKKADQALDRANRWLDWLQCSVNTENPDLGLQWLPGFLRREAEVKYVVATKDREEQADHVQALAGRDPLSCVIYLLLASVEPLSSEELRDLLVKALSADQLNRALVQLQLNGLIKETRNAN